MKLIPCFFILVIAALTTSCLKEKSNSVKCGLILNKTATGINVVYKDQHVTFYAVDTTTVEVNKQYCK